MVVNRVFPNNNGPTIRDLPKFDFDGHARLQKDLSNPKPPENLRFPVDPSLWTQGATISEDTAKRLTGNLLGKKDFDPDASMNEIIKDYYDSSLEDLRISTNLILKDFAEFLFPNNPDRLKDQPSLLSLRFLSKRGGVNVTAQKFVQALTEIEI